MPELQSCRTPLWNEIPLIDGHNCLGVVVARGGSKGLPRKNLADLCGRPLVAWSLDAANRSELLDCVVMSSDDEEILAAAQAAGCDNLIRRPAALASDTAPVADTLIHAADAMDRSFDYLVLLAATSPLRNETDIDACIRACHPNAPAAVTVCETPKPAEWICRLDPTGRLVALVPGEGLQTRRQDIAPAYQPNGAVYVARSDWFREHRTFYDDLTVASIMPASRSIDIDTETDLIVARLTAADTLHVGKQPK